MGRIEALETSEITDLNKLFLRGPKLAAIEVTTTEIWPKMMRFIIRHSIRKILISQSIRV